MARLIFLCFFLTVPVSLSAYEKMHDQQPIRELHQRMENTRRKCVEIYSEGEEITLEIAREEFYNRFLLQQAQNNESMREDCTRRITEYVDKINKIFDSAKESIETIKEESMLVKWFATGIQYLPSEFISADLETSQRLSERYQNKVTELWDTLDRESVKIAEQELDDPFKQCILNISQNDTRGNHTNDRARVKESLPQLEDTLKECDEINSKYSKMVQDAVLEDAYTQFILNKTMEHETCAARIMNHVKKVNRIIDSVNGSIPKMTKKMEEVISETKFVLEETPVETIKKNQDAFWQQNVRRKSQVEKFERLLQRAENEINFLRESKIEDEKNCIRKLCTRDQFRISGNNCILNEVKTKNRKSKKLMQQEVVTPRGVPDASVTEEERVKMIPRLG